MAEEERNSYLVYAMTRDSSGNRLASSYEEFLEQFSFEFFDRCKYYLLCWEFNLDPSWEEELPEAKALLKAQELRRLELQKKEEEKAKKEAAKKEKEESSAKKKTTRKTTSKKKTVTKKRTTSKKSSPRKKTSTATKEE